MPNNFWEFQKLLKMTLFRASFYFFALYIILYLLPGSKGEFAKECLGKKGPVEDPSGSCKTYYICSLFFGSKMSCPDNLLFSTELKTCTTPQEAKCKSSSSAPIIHKGECSRETDPNKCQNVAKNCDYCYDEYYRRPRCDSDWILGTKCENLASKIEQTKSLKLDWEDDTKGIKITQIVGKNEPFTIDIVIEYPSPKDSENDIQTKEFFSESFDFLNFLQLLTSPVESADVECEGLPKNDEILAKRSSLHMDAKLGPSQKGPPLGEVKFTGNSCKGGGPPEICPDFHRRTRFSMDLTTNNKCESYHGKIVKSQIILRYKLDGENSIRMIPVDFICPNNYN